MKSFLIVLGLILSQITYAQSNIQVRSLDLNADLAGDLVISLREQGAEYYSPVPINAELDIFRTNEHFASGLTGNIGRDVNKIEFKAGFAFYSADGKVVALLGTLGQQNHTNQQTPDELQNGSASVGAELVVLGFHGKNVASITYLPQIDAIKLSNTFTYAFNYMDWSVAIDFLKDLQSDAARLNIYSEFTVNLTEFTSVFTGVGYRHQSGSTGIYDGLYLRLGVKVKLQNTSRVKSLPLKEEE